ncbi:hypothetical protein DESUT3_10830 [Desulfuromonas versatilis]|uniref:Uncharacterized protein n=1 Tax=Desulfuromonas versatilis TaxID=2802975 RepID=A0ABN6DWV9_9BACT|nr:hypothetical protein [Desulfuromonas versatilis]BCR04014.1 hypothetical protein DESUT3_10830 [Desulfuromonas versatilis]
MLPTLSALLLFLAALLHSFSFMCRKLPAGRRPRLYPGSGGARVLLDLTWLLLFLTGAWLALQISTTLGILAAVVYFVVLPFVFQPPMARMMGFASLRAYLETVDRGQ